MFPLSEIEIDLRAGAVNVIPRTAKDIYQARARICIRRKIAKHYPFMAGKLSCMSAWELQAVFNALFYSRIEVSDLLRMIRR